MKFSRSTYDMALGEATIIFQDRDRNRLMLTGMLDVYIGNSGAVIKLVENDPPEDNGWPSGLLIDCQAHRPVGIIADDYDESGMFGILESDRSRLRVAEEFGEKFERLTYENSMRLLC